MRVYDLVIFIIFSNSKARTEANISVEAHLFVERLANKDLLASSQKSQSQYLQIIGQ